MMTFPIIATSMPLHTVTSSEYCRTHCYHHICRQLYTGSVRRRNRQSINEIERLSLLLSMILNGGEQTTGAYMLSVRDFITRLNQGQFIVAGVKREYTKDEEEAGSTDVWYSELRRRRTS